MPQSNYREKVALFLDLEQGELLRRLAQSLGFYISRGPGAGEVGNTKLLLEKLATAYREDPERVETLFRQIIQHDD